MKFGASMFFTDYSMTPAELAQALEQRGFDIVWAPEHSHIPLSRKTPFVLGGELPKRYYDVMDPFVTLTAAAMATRTLKVGTGVCLIAQRDPIQTAKLVASIDQVSGGRFVFGIGNGWNQDEMENHGTDFAPATSWRASASRRCRRSGPRTPPNTTASSSISVRCRPGRSRCRSRIRRSWWAARFPTARGGPSVTATAGCRSGTQGSPTPLTELIPRFRQMAAEAGRDPAGFDISIGGQAEDIDLIKRDPVAVEVHDGDHPLLHRPPRRGPSCIATGVGPAEGGPEHDRVAGDYQLLDVDVQVGERLVVAADGLGPGRRTGPERVDVCLCVEIGDGLVVPAIPDFLDELAHLHLAFGRVHRCLRSLTRSRMRLEPRYPAAASLGVTRPISSSL